MTISLRNELYETAQRVADQKKELEAENHRKLVENYLKNLCMEIASEGKFEVLITKWTFEDGTGLTDEDIRVFAQDYDLDYTPRNGLDLPVLSFRSPR